MSLATVMGPAFCHDPAAISGRLASDDVTQDRLDIRSYIDTARKHGQNAMDDLHHLMAGAPLATAGPGILPVTTDQQTAPPVTAS